MVTKETDLVYISKLKKWTNMKTTDDNMAKLYIEVK